MAQDRRNSQEARKMDEVSRREMKREEHVKRENGTESLRRTMKGKSGRKR